MTKQIIFLKKFFLILSINQHKPRPRDGSPVPVNLIVHLPPLAWQQQQQTQLKTKTKIEMSWYTLRNDSVVCQLVCSNSPLTAAILVRNGCYETK